MNDNATQQTEFVLRRLSDPFHLFGREVSGFAWLAVLIPVLVLGVVYVGWMYRRDARGVGWAWAAFLGTLRTAVYLILAGIFLANYRTTIIAIAPLAVAQFNADVITRFPRRQRSFVAIGVIAISLVAVGCATQRSRSVLYIQFLKQVTGSAELVGNEQNVTDVD